MNECNVMEPKLPNPMRIGFEGRSHLSGNTLCQLLATLPLLGLAACGAANTPYGKSVACMRAYNQAIFPLSTGEPLYRGDTNKSMADFARLRSNVMSTAKTEGISELDANKAISDSLSSVANEMKNNSPADNDRLVREARTSLANCLR